MFKLWQNEAMTTEYGSQGNGSRFQTLNFDAAGGSIDLVMYFGSPNKAYTLRTAKNSGIDNITLSVTDALADHIVHVLPQELHEYDEKTNTEGHEEQR